MTLLTIFGIFSGTSDKLIFESSVRWELLFPLLLFDDPEFPILCNEIFFNDASSADRFFLSLSDFLAFANARL